MPERRAADPGWYPDPAAEDDTFRWWTGGAWTAWLTTDPGAPPPPHGRAELGPAAAAEVPAGPRGRFGTVPRIAMAVVAVMMLVAGMIVTGWPDREQVALTQPPPTRSYQPPDLTVQCGTTWVIGGEVATQPVGFDSDGPQRSDPLPFLHCRGKIEDAGGNLLISLSLTDEVMAEEEPLAYLEERMNVLARTIYVDGAATVANLESGAYGPLERSWRATADFELPGGLPADHVEIIAIELESGRWAIWTQLAADDLPAQVKEKVTAARDRLTRS